MMTYYWDMDGVLADFHTGYTSRALAFSREYLANLPAFAANVAILNALIASGVRCYILTKAASEEAKAGKLDWLAKHVPALTADRFICIVGYGKKIDHIREDGTLIDDDARNCREWEKGGQTAYHLEEKGEPVAL